MFPLPYEHAQLVDKFDELQMLGDPKPSLVMNAANAMGRAKDDVIPGRPALETQPPSNR